MKLQLEENELRRHLLLGLTKDEILDVTEEVDFTTYCRRPQCWINDHAELRDHVHTGYDFIEAIVTWMHEAGPDAVHSSRCDKVDILDGRKMHIKDHSFKKGNIMVFTPVQGNAWEQRCVVAHTRGDEIELEDDLFSLSGMLQANYLRSVAEWKLLKRNMHWKMWKAQCFVSHAQLEPLRHTLSWLPSNSTRYWLDYITLRLGLQPENEFRVEEINEILLHHVEGLTSLVDQHQTYFTRLFCLYEFSFMHKKPGQHLLLGNLCNVAVIDAQQAKCRCPKATRQIEDHITAQFGGFSQFTEKIQETALLHKCVLRACSLELHLKVGLRMESRAKWFSRWQDTVGDVLRSKETVCSVLEAVTQNSATECKAPQPFSVVDLSRSRPEMLKATVLPRPSTVASLQQLRNAVMTGTFDRALDSAFASEEFFVKVDRTCFADYFDQNYLALEELTNHQFVALHSCLAKRHAHLKGPAGSGKTFLALHMALDAIRNEPNARVMFVVAVPAMLCFITKWMHGRVGSTQRLHDVLKRTRFAALRSFQQRTIDEAENKLSWYEIKLDDADAILLEECSQQSIQSWLQPLQLLIIDEANMLCKCKAVIALLGSCRTTPQILCLSDDAQSADGTCELKVIDSFETVELHEVIRCTPRIVAAAMSFQVGPYRPLTKCHLEGKAGPFLQAHIFQKDPSNCIKRTYAQQTSNALANFMERNPELNLHNRVAVLVSDDSFRSGFDKALQQVLDRDRPHHCHFLVQDAVAGLLRATQAVDSGTDCCLVCDSLDRFAGLEKMVVVLVGLDQVIEESDIAGMHLGRSKLYRGISRAQYQVILVNEDLPGGWLEFLRTLQLEDDQEVDAAAQPVQVAKSSTRDMAIERLAGQHPHGDEAVEQQVSELRSAPITLTRKIKTQGLYGGEVVDDLMRNGRCYEGYQKGSSSAEERSSEPHRSANVQVVKQNIWQVKDSSIRTLERAPRFQPFAATLEMPLVSTSASGADGAGGAGGAGGVGGAGGAGSTGGSGGTAAADTALTSSGAAADLAGNQEYKGDLSKGKAHGYGTFRTSDGACYHGQWEHNQRSGAGMYVGADGAKYEGQWKEHEKSGSGIECYPDGASYKGEFRKGCKHGFGKYTMSSGATYEGQFANDKYDGEGCYNFASSRNFTGQWKEGRIHGIGKMVWAGGVIYEGSFQHDVRHGEGIVRWPGGRALQGRWQKGRLTVGSGVMLDEAKAEKLNG